MKRNFKNFKEFYKFRKILQFHGILVFIELSSSPKNSLRYCGRLRGPTVASFRPGCGSADASPPDPRFRRSCKQDGIHSYQAPFCELLLG